MTIAHPLRTIYTILLLVMLGSSAIDPLDTPNRTHSLTFKFDTSRGRFNEDYVDRLELRAATRALLNLQNNGTPHAVPDPPRFGDATDIAEQLSQARASDETNTANNRIKHCDDASNGSFTEGFVTMEVTGPSRTSLDIYTVHAVLSGDGVMPPSEATKFTKDFLFPVHPEHYELLTTNGIGVTETWAGIPTSSYLDALAIPQPFVVNKRDLSYEIGIIVRGYLGDADKATATWILRQTRQTASGVDFNLHVWYPSACPSEYVHDQVEHLCIGFRNGPSSDCGLFWAVRAIRLDVPAHRLHA